MTFQILAAIFLACIGGAWLLFPLLMLSKANQIIKGQKETNRLLAEAKMREHAKQWNMPLPTAEGIAAAQAVRDRHTAKRPVALPVMPENVMETALTDERV